MNRSLLLLFACGAWIASAATFTVTHGGDAGAGSLRQAIIDANGDGVADIINIDAGLTIAPTSGEMAITTPVTINGGAGVTIDGSGNGRPVFVFSTSSDTWLVDSITFSGFSSSGLSGGVIRTQGGALWTLTIQNCTFDNNDNVTNWGGRNRHRKWQPLEPEHRQLQLYR